MIPTNSQWPKLQVILYTVVHSITASVHCIANYSQYLQLQLNDDIVYTASNSYIATCIIIIMHTVCSNTVYMDCSTYSQLMKLAMSTACSQYSYIAIVSLHVCCIASSYLATQSHSLYGYKQLAIVASFIQSHALCSYSILILQGRKYIQLLVSVPL